MAVEIPGLNSTDYLLKEILLLTQQLFFKKCTSPYWSHVHLWTTPYSIQWDGITLGSGPLGLNQEAKAGTQPYSTQMQLYNKQCPPWQRPSHRKMTPLSSSSLPCTPFPKNAPLKNTAFPEVQDYFSIKHTWLYWVDYKETCWRNISLNAFTLLFS